MNKPIASLVILLALGLPALANTAATLDAGQLTGPSSAPMQADDTSPSTNGSLLLLIELGPTGTVDNSLLAGEYVSGGNTILAAGGFNANGGTNETLTNFVFSGTTGQVIAVRWFPQITLAQFESGTVAPANGDYFGTYTPSGTPDGGDSWIVPNPASGSTLSLNFYTTDSDGGGTQSPSEGVANLLVGGSEISSTPEPSTVALLGCGMLVLVLFLRRRKSA